MSKDIDPTNSVAPGQINKTRKSSDLTANQWRFEAAKNKDPNLFSRTSFLKHSKP